jgi:hypothetical protein
MITGADKNMEYLFYNLPLWIVLLVTVGIIFAAFESGFLLGRHRYKRSDKEKDSLVGPMVGVTLGLLAFMLAFTFNVAADHFNTRRHLVLDEANAIRSAYAMAGMLAENQCSESRKLLREYVDIRLADILTREEVQRMISRSDEIQDQLWSIAMTSEAQSTKTSSSWLYVQSLSDMINMQAKRITYGMHGKISASIWVVLYWLTVMGMAAMGYHAGLIGIRGFFAYPVLILTFSLVLVLIYDLDRPKQRLFNVSQQAMMDLQQRLAEPDAKINPKAN